MLGLAEGAFEHGVKYTLERKQFGQPIFEFQVSTYKNLIFLYINLSFFTGNATSNLKGGN